MRRIKTVKMLMAIYVITGAAAISVALAPVTLAQTASGATHYNYQKITLDQASPYFVFASFATAAGLSLYSASYVRLRKRSRKSARYASRTFDYTKTMY